MSSFFNIHTHGFVRVAAATPLVRVADPDFNAERTLEMVKEGVAKAASLLLFPELGLSSYAIDDLLHQSALLDGIERAVARICEATREVSALVFVGAPVRAGDRLYNVGLALQRGRILAAFPKTYLPNYREFYEKRHFASGAGHLPPCLLLAGQHVPLGTDILLAAEDILGFVVHAEICEDLWAPVPPSVQAALAGARVLVNLSASNVTIGKAELRHRLAEVQSARLAAAYLYSAAGNGESTTDLAWDGQAMIYENGTLLAEAKRFSEVPSLVMADIDLERLGQERQRLTSFGDSADLYPPSKPFRKIPFLIEPDRASYIGLARTTARFPFVPDDPDRLSELCYEAYNIQSQALRQRLAASGTKRVVIGVSGGLDSTQALLVAAHAFDSMGLPRTDILGYSLPGLATSLHTRAQAHRLMEALGVSSKEVDITAACRQMLTDIDHPYERGEKVHDITFENVQAGARTSLLFRLANHHQAIVLGTGDLSELALGWCTYGVGDHMSHYNVNASVPKTLIQHLIRWVAREKIFGEEASPVLNDILDTEISPELIPGDGNKPSQRTEDFVGPYALQDFSLYYTTRFGFGPRKIAFLAYHAWRDATAGPWPRGLPEDQRVAYDLAAIKRWMSIFVHRFFVTSQFKRSAVPNGPKISSGGSLSPRGDWRAPSDSSAQAWNAELRRIPENEEPSQR